MTQEGRRRNGLVGSRGQSATLNSHSEGPEAEPKEPVIATGKTTNKRMTSNLVALSSVAILSVFGVGYARTQDAADLMANQGGATGASTGLAAVLPSTKARSPSHAAPTETAVTAPPDGIQVADDSVGPIGQAAPSFPTVAAPSPNLATAPTATSAAPAAKPTSPRAIPTLPAATPTIRPNIRNLRDGSFVGDGFSRHGDIEATVIVSAGKIVSANVTGCGTRYSCNVVRSLVSEVVSRQTAPVDLVSGATDSSRAYHDAIVKALSQAT